MTVQEACATAMLGHFLLSFSLSMLLPEFVLPSRDRCRQDFMFLNTARAQFQHPEYKERVSRINSSVLPANPFIGAQCGIIAKFL